MNLYAKIENFVSDMHFIAVTKFIYILSKLNNDDKSS